MSELLLDAAGRRRSPATLPEFHAGRPPRNKGMRYPADPPTIEENVTLMRHAGDGVHGRRLRGLIVVLWRAGLRICEALALAEADVDARRGSLLVRRGKGGRRREVGMDDWAWQQLAPWLQARLKLPVGHTVLRRRRRHARAALGGRRRAHRAAPRRPRRRREATLRAAPAAPRSRR
jgi:site-specific recombinase XerC